MKLRQPVKKAFEQRDLVELGYSSMSNVRLLSLLELVTNQWLRRSCMYMNDTTPKRGRQVGVCQRKKNPKNMFVPCNPQDKKAISKDATSNPLSIGITSSRFLLKLLSALFNLPPQDLQPSHRVPPRIGTPFPSNSRTLPVPYTRNSGLA